MCRQDRGVRQDLKRRNERGSIAFAFGSSTPRMLDPVEGVAYWGSRRWVLFFLNLFNYSLTDYFIFIFFVKGYFDDQCYDFFYVGAHGSG